MTHGPTEAEHDTTDGEHSDDTAAATSSRFRIEIDAFGRVVPRVIPADSDTKDPAR